MPPQIRRDNSPEDSEVSLWRSRDNSPESDEGNTRQRVEPPAGGSGYISDGATTVPYSSLAFFWNYGRVFRRHHLPNPPSSTGAGSALPTVCRIRDDSYAVPSFVGGSVIRHHNEWMEEVD